MPYGQRVESRLREKTWSSRMEVGHGAINSILLIALLFRNLTVETGCRGGQGSPKAVAPTGRQAAGQAWLDDGAANTF
jgi:hypothetical protein